MASCLVPQDIYVDWSLNILYKCHEKWVTYVVEITERVDVQDVDIHRRKEQIGQETGEHMPWIESQQAPESVY